MLKFINADDFWKRLKKYEGEMFHTITGLEFTYGFIGENSIKRIVVNNCFQKPLSSYQSVILGRHLKQYEVQHMCIAVLQIDV